MEKQEAVNADVQAAIIQNVASTILDGIGLMKFINLPEKSRFIFAGILDLHLKMYEQIEHLLNDQRKSPNDSLSSAEQKKIIGDFTKVTIDHFFANLEGKLSVCLAELLAESFYYAVPRIHKINREPPEIVGGSLPTHQEYQHNVARFGMKRYRILHLRETRLGQTGAFDNEKGRIAQAVDEMFQASQLWTYDHKRIAHLLRDEIIDIWKRKQDNFTQDASTEDLEANATTFAAHVSDLIWDRLGHTYFFALNLLFETAWIAAMPLQSIKEGKHERELKARSLTELKKEYFYRDIDRWLGLFEEAFQDPGRPPVRPQTEAWQRNRSEFLEKAQKAAAIVVTLDKGNVAMAMGYGKPKSSGQKGQNKDSAQKTLKRKMDTYSISWEEIIEKRPDKK
ncbi:MAG: hypothetical protein HOP19_28955 [Acidobacteria bacterium]|nr:hypothetical protein [Acidobacteriota bacterium]